jgi:hypothetical protein
VITTVDANHREDRYHQIVGGCFFIALILLGVVLVWHFLVGAGNYRVIGSVAAGALLLMDFMHSRGAKF